MLEQQRAFCRPCQPRTAHPAHQHQAAHRSRARIGRPKRLIFRRVTLPILSQRRIGWRGWQTRCSTWRTWKAARLPHQISPSISHPCCKCRRHHADARPEAGIALETDAANGLPAVKVHLEQVEAAVLNLLDNAIKYTPSGGKVNLAACADGRWLVVRVADTGSGISARKDLPISSTASTAFQKNFAVAPKAGRTG